MKPHLRRLPFAFPQRGQTQSMQRHSRTYGVPGTAKNRQASSKQRLCVYDSPFIKGEFGLGAAYVAETVRGINMLPNRLALRENRIGCRVVSAGEVQNSQSVQRCPKGLTRSIAPPGRCGVLQTEERVRIVPEAHGGYAAHPIEMRIPVAYATSPDPACSFEHSLRPQILSSPKEHVSPLYGHTYSLRIVAKPLCNRNAFLVVLLCLHAVPTLPGMHPKMQQCDGKRTIFA